MINVYMINWSGELINVELDLEKIKAIKVEVVCGDPVLHIYNKDGSEGTVYSDECSKKSSYKDGYYFLDLEKVYDVMYIPKITYDRDEDVLTVAIKETARVDTEYFGENVERIIHPDFF